MAANTTTADLLLGSMGLDMDDDFGIDIDSLLNTVNKELERNEVYDENNKLDNYLWVLTAFGVPGNIMTIVTILTLGKKSPATFFVALLAVCDGSALVTKLMFRQFVVNGIWQGTAFCKIELLPAYLTSVANWVLVLITFERFFSVCYPLKKAYLFTNKRSYMMAGVMVVTLFAIFAVVSGAFYKYSGKHEKACGYDEGVKEVWYWINLCIFLFFPFLFNAIFTGLIILGLYLSRRDRRKMLIKPDSASSSKTTAAATTSSASSSSNAANKKQRDNNHKLIRETERAERMITIMLIIASALFLILTLPGCIRIMIYEKSDNVVTEARWQKFKVITYLLIDSTHAINFFLYFISAKRFRNQFIYLVTCKRYPKKRSGSRTTSNATDTTKLSTAGDTTNNTNSNTRM